MEQINGNRIAALIDAKPARKPRKGKSKAAVTARCEDSLKVWANCGVWFMLGLSALLNGYANAQHATVGWAGWGMGMAIPLIILILAKVGGLTYKRGVKSVAYAAAVAGIGLLLLSVAHCSLSISLLTGANTVLAAPMAIAIDAGLVVCELAVLIVL